MTTSSLFLKAEGKAVPSSAGGAVRCAFLQAAVLKKIFKSARYSAKAFLRTQKRE